MTQATLKMQLEIVEEFTVHPNNGTIGETIDAYINDYLPVDGTIKGISIELDTPLRLSPLANTLKKAIRKTKGVEA
jgi:hypothetical protein